MRTRFRVWVSVCAAAVLPGLSAAQTCSLERASTSYLGVEADGWSTNPSLSADGRFVAFESAATNLVPGDTNHQLDIFLLDRQTQVLQRVSLSSSGQEANGGCIVGRVSGDGTKVSFLSWATNLDPADTDSHQDVYVHDTVTQQTSLVSVRLGGTPSTKGCGSTAISADGRFVAFDCLDSNVLPGVGADNVYVRDLTAQVTEQVSMGPAGLQGNGASRDVSLSGDGRFVAFSSRSTNWFPVSAGFIYGVFVRDRLLGATLPTGMLANGLLAPGVGSYPNVSEDGRFVSFMADSPLLLPGQAVDFNVLRWDRFTGERINVSATIGGAAPNGVCRGSDLSADGRFVAFDSQATNLVVQDQVSITHQTHAYWRDLATNTTVGASESPSGALPDDQADHAALSADGRVTAFDSTATNLLPGASGNVGHVYVRACDVASPSSFCRPKQPVGGCTARMTVQGAPSASAGSGFTLSAQSLPTSRLGLLFYGTSGSAGARIPDGFLCVQAPYAPVHVRSSGGSAGCTGALATDFNAWIASGVDPALVSGQAVCAQAWFRDPLGAGQLSDALAFLIGP